MSNVTTLIVVGAVMFAVLGGVTLLSHIYSLNGIKSRTVGDGQHGTARWATTVSYTHLDVYKRQGLSFYKRSLSFTNAGSLSLPAL